MRSPRRVTSARVRQKAYAYVHPPGRTLFFVHGQNRCVALAPGVAQVAPRAAVAGRFAGAAQRRAQLHQGLDVVAGTLRGEVRRHQLADAPLHVRPAHVRTP